MLFVLTTKSPTRLRPCAQKVTWWEKGNVMSYDVITSLLLSLSSSHHVLPSKEENKAVLSPPASASASEAGRRTPFLVFTRDTRRGDRERERGERGRCGFHAARDEAELTFPVSPPSLAVSDSHIANKSQQTLQSGRKVPATCHESYTFPKGTASICQNRNFSQENHFKII